jgi:tetratricopeptide (TPR) repeat protein
MREAVYQRLTEAQACAEEGDMECARKHLEDIGRIRDLNSYEVAQRWYFYAFIYLNAENYPEAISAYERVLEQPDLPLSLEQDTMLALAQLYVQQERYAEGLRMLERWFETAENPGTTPYVLKAQIHYQLQQHAEGIPAILTAMEIAQRQGRTVEESWYQLLNVFYYELENYPKVIETLGILTTRWPKKDYVVQLAGIYGQEGQEDTMLALYEAAYEANWLSRGQEVVNLAQMLLQADVPYKAATLLQKGLDDGSIEGTEANWRLLSQAWQLAQEDEKALPALTRAADLSRDGELNVRLAQSYVNLARWGDCADAARDAIRRGGLDRPDQANLLLGNCLAELKDYEGARAAFTAASRDDRSRSAARQWLDYIENEQDRERQLAAARRG